MHKNYSGDCLGNKNILLKRMSTNQNKSLNQIPNHQIPLKKINENRKNWEIHQQLLKPDLKIQRAKSAGQKTFEKTEPKLKRQYNSSLSGINRKQFNSIGSNNKMNKSRDLSKNNSQIKSNNSLGKKQFLIQKINNPCNLNKNHNASTNTEIMNSIESLKNNLFNDKRYSFPVEIKNSKSMTRADNTSQKTINAIQQFNNQFEDQNNRVCFKNSFVSSFNNNDQKIKKKPVYFIN